MAKKYEPFEYDPGKIYDETKLPPERLADIEAKTRDFRNRMIGMALHSLSFGATHSVVNKRRAQLQSIKGILPIIERLVAGETTYEELAAERNYTRLIYVHRGVHHFIISSVYYSDKERESWSDDDYRNYYQDLFGSDSNDFDSPQITDLSLARPYLKKALERHRELMKRYKFAETGWGTNWRYEIPNHELSRTKQRASS